MTGVPEPIARTEEVDGAVGCEQQLEEMERRWRHTAADLQNVKRRYRQDFEREREMERRRAAERRFESAGLPDQFGIPNRFQGFRCRSTTRRST